MNNTTNSDGTGSITVDSVWQLCPKCNGQGHVSKPPWVPGDVEMWVSSDTGTHTCQVCNGNGVIKSE